MARSPKIKKKKSFMFTTKHHSFLAIMGVVLFVLCLGILITSVVNAFNTRGDIDISFGYYCFFAALLDIIGIFCGICGLRERDTFVIAPWLAIGGNTFVLLLWALLLLISRG